MRFWARHTSTSTRRMMKWWLLERALRASGFRICKAWILFWAAGLLRIGLGSSVRQDTVGGWILEGVVSCRWCMALCLFVDIGRMTWEGETYSVNDIDLDVSSFGSSDGAIDPDNWLSGAIDVLDADTWFQTSESATRRVSNRPLVSVGAGFRPAGPVVVAANLTARSREALANGGWTGGVSGGIRITNAWIVESGIQRGSSDVWRFPASMRVSLENGWEIGFRTGDVSALWEGSQLSFAPDLLPEIPCWWHLIANLSQDVGRFRDCRFSFSMNKLFSQFSLQSELLPWPKHVQPFFF